MWRSTERGAASPMLRGLARCSAARSVKMLPRAGQARKLSLRCHAARVISRSSLCGVGASQYLLGTTGRLTPQRAMRRLRMSTPTSPWRSPAMTAPLGSLCVTWASHTCPAPAPAWCRRRMATSTSATRMCRLAMPKGRSTPSGIFGSRSIGSSGSRCQRQPTLLLTASRLLLKQYPHKKQHRRSWLPRTVQRIRKKGELAQPSTGCLLRRFLRSMCSSQCCLNSLVLKSTGHMQPLWLHGHRQLHATWLYPFQL
mmetsp:Transcript_36698/g.92286  ORF Transcript_36698/g.92286 Transcript_36698/m.92286 type:complete len:255 (+) Transcript_36698:1737-2501(+)